MRNASTALGQRFDRLSAPVRLCACAPVCAVGILSLSKDGGDAERFDRLCAPVRLCTRLHGRHPELVEGWAALQNASTALGQRFDRLSAPVRLGLMRLHG